MLATVVGFAFATVFASLKVGISTATMGVSMYMIAATIEKRTTGWAVHGMQGEQNAYNTT